jgi:dynein light chain roadblock-type
MSPELEQTLSMLSSHRSVLGYMLVTRGHHPSIIRHSGVVFDGEQGKRYAAVVARIVESVQAGLEEVRVDDGLTAAATGETDVVRGSIPTSTLFHENSNNIVFARMKFDS